MRNLRDAFTTYKKYRLQMMALEALATHGAQHEVDYKIRVLSLTDASMVYKVKEQDFEETYRFFFTIGYIAFDPNTERVSLTKSGIQAIKDCTFQRLSLDAFNNYIELKNRSLSLKISVLALVISMISLAIGYLKPMETHPTPPHSTVYNQTFAIEKDTSHVSLYKSLRQ